MDLESLLALDRSASLCHRLDFPGWAGLDCWIKRDDLLHPVVSGNKFRKLNYSLAGVAAGTPLLSMGGAYSNHLHALAEVAARMQCPLTALLRGEPCETPTLNDCIARGMRVQWLTRTEYRALRAEPDRWRHYSVDARTHWIAEGGSGVAAVRGVAELIDELPFIPDTLITAVGTGATLAGLVLGMRGRGRVLGLPVLRHAGYLRADIARWLQQCAGGNLHNWGLLEGYVRGGFAEADAELLAFVQTFFAQTAVPVEPVYTAKVCYALAQLHAGGVFRAGERVLVLHTGGLQGARGFAGLS